MATLAERVISGKGLLRLPASADLDKAKRLTLYVDVVRLPFNGYYNANYNPPKGRYATINVFKAGYLQREICIEYPRQRFDFWADDGAQTSYYVKCAYHLLIDHLNEMKQKLGLLMDDSPNPFEFWYHTQFAFDELRIVCYSDSALRLVVESEEFQLCPADEEPTPPPPPPPPEEPLDVPPGTSLGDENYPVSPPYQSPDDDGDTAPYPGDDFPTPVDPPGGCWETFTTYSSGSPSSTTDYTVGLSTDSPGFRIQSGGLWWEMYDTGSGRTMRTEWVGVAITPTLVSAIWKPVCPSTPYGIPPT